MDNNHNNKNDAPHSHHITPMKVYYSVWAALLIFTVITVTSSYFDFGGTNNIMIAMAIATAKALLVTLYFMGLKYEGAENNVTFLCAFFSLAIFVGLSASDLFYRVDSVPVKVVDDGTGGSGGGDTPIDLNAFMAPTPELTGKGKTLFAQQCIACHGADGKGDGPAAAALNPKPRNFTLTEGWKNGRSLGQVFKTLTQGLPGTPMASFAAISVEDRLALSHYVRSLGPAPAADTAEDQALLKTLAGGTGPKKTHLPIDYTLDLMSEGQ